MKYIADHIIYDEYACPCCGELPPLLYTADSLEPEMSSEYVLLFSGYDAIISKFGRRIPVSRGGGYRCTDYQLSLYKRKKTTTPFSVHIFGLALDGDVDNEDEVREVVKIAKSLQHIYKFRIGWKSYLAKGMTFVHVDVGWLITPRFSDKLKECSEW